jgi:1,4-alpha-glucan branching enzyme
MKGGSDMVKKEKKKVEKRAKETQKVSSRDVAFTFHAPEATEVFLAGEFNNWNQQLRVRWVGRRNKQCKGLLG